MNVAQAKDYLERIIQCLEIKKKNEKFVVYSFFLFL